MNDRDSDGNPKGGDYRLRGEAMTARPEGIALTMSASSEGGRVMELREKIADIITKYEGGPIDNLLAADAILAIPEIRDALALRRAEDVYEALAADKAAFERGQGGPSAQP